MLRFYKYNWASLVAQTVKNLPVMQETWVWSLVQEDPLEKEMATHSIILAWRSPWTKQPGGLQSMGLHRVRHDWVTNTFTHFATSLLWSEVVLLSFPEGILHYHSSRMKVSDAHFQKFFIYRHICCHRFLEDRIIHLRLLLLAKTIPKAFWMQWFLHFSEVAPAGITVLNP